MPRAIGARADRAGTNLAAGTGSGPSATAAADNLGTKANAEPAETVPEFDPGSPESPGLSSPKSCTGYKWKTKPSPIPRS